MEAEEAVRCPITEFEPPDYLETETERKRFRAVVELLQTVDVSMCTALDADQVARYVLSERDYIALTKQLKKAIKAGDPEATGRVQRQQNTAFQQVQACASAIGMNIASRLKLDLRKPKEEPDNPFASFER